MKIFLFIVLCIGGTTYLLFYGGGLSKELKQVETIQSNKSHRINLAQLNTENPKGNEDSFPQLPSDEKSNPEKDPEKEQSLEPESQTDEDDKIKREEEFTKYCESAPDDPQCD